MPPGATPRRSEAGATGTYHHGNLREALLDATLDIVARDGVAGFSLNAAARAAGVSSAAPYRHFASKDALVTEAIGRSFTQLHERLHVAAQAHPDDSLARLSALGASYVAFAGDQPAAFRLLFRHHSVDPGPGGQATFTVLSACVEQADRDGRLRSGLVTADVVRAAWSLVHGLATLHLDGALGRTGLPPLDGATTRSTLEVFVDGLRRR